MCILISVLTFKQFKTVRKVNQNIFIIVVVVPKQPQKPQSSAAVVAGVAALERQQSGGGGRSTRPKVGVSSDGASVRSITDKVWCVLYGVLT